jgi:hypothetical protein
MRTILIECDKSIRSQAQQNARIVTRSDVKLGASCWYLVKRSNGNNIGLVALACFHNLRAAATKVPAKNAKDVSPRNFVNSLRVA